MRNTPLDQKRVENPASIEAPALSRVYTVEETMAIVRLSRNALYRAIDRGEIPSLRLGRRILIPAAALDELLRAGNR